MSRLDTGMSDDGDGGGAGNDGDDSLADESQSEGGTSVATLTEGQGAVASGHGGRDNAAVPLTLNRAAIELAQRQAAHEEDERRLGGGLQRATASSTGGTHGSTGDGRSLAGKSAWSSLEDNDDHEAAAAEDAARETGQKLPRQGSPAAPEDGGQARGAKAKTPRALSPVTALQDLPLESPTSSAATGSLGDRSSSERTPNSQRRWLDKTSTRRANPLQRRSRRATLGQTGHDADAAEDAPASKLHQVRCFAA